jgi:acyl-CoA reductase-like NAD-dependent aldehyde dehydrogenase
MTNVAQAERAAATTFPIVNPANGAHVADVAICGPAEVDAIVATAKAAARDWGRRPGEERARLMLRLAELLDEHHEEIGRLDTSCTGKVIRDSIPEALKAGRIVRYWAGYADKIFGRELADSSERLSYTRREPLGVYGVIVPWNGPILSLTSRVMPALACGNVIVVKPSELSPLSALRVVELAREAGFPEGVLSVITGFGDAGSALVSHPDVSGVSFTGSVGTGRKVAAAAAESFKKVTLELGGKSPIVVFDDCDLDSAALAALLGIAFNAGQVCAASTRLIVHEDVADEFIARVVARAANLKIGDPLDPDSQVGPVACQAQFDKVLGFIETGVSEGGEVVLGGGRPATGPASQGLFIMPTVIVNKEPGRTVDTEEIFGPVLSVQTFKDEADALALANDTNFGLSSYVWTKDVSRLLRMVEGIEAGVVHGNTTFVNEAKLPFGGYKDSGVGGAYGEDAIEGCTRTKRVTIRFSADPLPSPWPGV